MATRIKIATATIGSGGGSGITFSSIPSSFDDICVEYTIRGTNASTDTGLFVRLNSDTTSAYTYKFLRGDSANAGSGGTTTTFMYFGNFPASSSTASTFGNGEFFIPKYAGGAAKTVCSDSVSENNSTAGWMTLAAGYWSGTNPVTTILLYPEAGNFAEFSTATLYGISNK